MTASSKKPVPVKKPATAKTTLNVKAKPSAKPAKSAKLDKPIDKTARAQKPSRTSKKESAPEPKTVESPAAKKTRKPAASKAKAAPPALRLLQLTGDGTRANAGFEPYFAAPPNAIEGLQLPILDTLGELAQDTQLQKSRLWGLMPADLTARTGLDAVQWRAAIEANPGYDLYYCSAHPEVEAVYHNPWRAPVVTHPQFIDISRKLFKAAGLSERPLDAISHSSLFATGHMMVASPAVWKQYLAFASLFFAQAITKLDPATQTTLFAEKPEAGRMTHLALIVARLPGLFLMLKNAQFRAYKLPLPAQEKALNQHLRMLREMKDQALEQGSSWLAASWSGYRNLYLGHVMGGPWLLKHGNAINPEVMHTAVPVAQVYSPYPRLIEKRVAL
jgi:hypothetical protein